MEISQKIVDQIKQKRSEGVYGRVLIQKDFPELTVDQIRKAIHLVESDTPVNNVVVKEAPKIKRIKKGISLTELRSKHDNKFIIQTNAEKLEKDIFLTDSEFKTSCNFNTGYKDAIERSEFSQYKGKAGSTIYWSHPDSIKKLKDEGVLKDVN